MIKKMSFLELLKLYENTLLDNVVPFWIRNGIDDEYGGIFNCIRDDGTIINTDKYIWSQGRALWTFSALYNRINKKKEWLEIATKLKNFLILSDAVDQEGAWSFAVSREGKRIIPPQSIYADAFAILGLIEFSKISKNEDAMQIALKSYQRVKPLLNDHSSLPTEPNRIPTGYEHHGPKMIYSLIAYEVGALFNDQSILKEAYQLADQVMDHHYDDKTGLVREFITYEKKIINNDVGMTIVPGHAIESMWFFAHIYQYWNEPEKVKKVLRIIKNHLEFGWDRQFGGVFLAKRIDGGKAVWWNPEAKVWWVFTECMYALILAHEILGEEWCMNWYWKIHDYAFKHFPDKKHGEWTQNLNRKGEIIDVVTSLKVKDFFHLPRALIMTIESLKRIINKES